MTIKAGFFGFGLIGGSLAKHIRKAYPDATIYAYDIDTNGLNLAIEDGTLTAFCNSPDDKRFGECNYLYLCTPVSFAKDFLPYIKSYIKPDCILTDVGSVKNVIHKEIKQAGLGSYFIGAHPMAGSEKSGYQNATDTLFENAYYILTPEADTSKDMLERYTTFVASLGAIPLVLNYEEHDFVTAGISHLPHIAASALVNLVAANDSAAEHMKRVAAGGFKDITRIASSSPIMWQNICLANRDAVLQLLDSYISILQTMREQIDNQDEQAIIDFFSSARTYRNNLSDAKKGAIHSFYAIQCDLTDRVGEISTITSILAEHALNLKNLGILHNREGMDGILQLEFYDEVTLHKATEVLSEAGFPVFEN